MSRHHLTVVQMLPALNEGGVERGTLEISRALVAAGHTSLVISAGGNLAEQLHQHGGRHLPWPVGTKSPLTLRYLPRLRHLLLARQVDILHLRSRVPAWLGYLTWLTIPVSRRPHLVTTFHGFYSINGYSAVMCKGERVIAISKAIQQHISDHYGISRQKIILIPRGVDVDIFSPRQVAAHRCDVLRKKWHLPTGSPILMMPGRLTRLKGHALLFHALAQCQTSPWILVIVGNLDRNPAFTRELRLLTTQLGIAQRVRFAGHCADMPAAYMLSDVVISPTSAKPEAFGRVAVEAAAMGKPVLTAGHGGSLETVVPEQTGWFFSPGDQDSLTATLQRILATSHRWQSMGASGRKRVVAHFTTTAMTHATLALYQNLACRT